MDASLGQKVLTRFQSQVLFFLLLLVFVKSDEIIKSLDLCWICSLDLGFWIPITLFCALYLVLLLIRMVSYLRYDPCRPTSTCSRRRPYKIPVHTLDSTVRRVSSLAGINRCDNPSQSISKWLLVLQYTIEAEYFYYCCKRDNWD